MFMFLFIFNQVAGDKPFSFDVTRAKMILKNFQRLLVYVVKMAENIKPDDVERNKPSEIRFSRKKSSPGLLRVFNLCLEVPRKLFWLCR